MGHEPARPEGAADQAPGPLDGRGPVRHVEGRHHDGHVARHPRPPVSPERRPVRPLLRRPDPPAGPAEADLSAFRFPFVAYARKGGIFVWGRTPWGKPGRVVVYQSSTGRWKQRAFLTANANGIFSGMVKGTKTGFVRAQLAVGGKAANGRSLGFSLKQPPDRLIPIFGSGG